MVTPNTLVDHFNGKSTDDKPTNGVRNGSVFFEMDTGLTYMFDEEHTEWLVQPSN